MATMSSAERNLVTASLPAAARRALLKARELDKLDETEVQKACADMGKEDRDRSLPWMDSCSAAAAILTKCPLEQQVEALEGMVSDDEAAVLGGMRPEGASLLLVRIPVRLRTLIMAEMTVATAGNVLHKMAAHDKKATLAGMPLEMEQAVYRWQNGELSGDVKLGDTSCTAKSSKAKSGSKPAEANTTVSERRRSRGKKRC